MAITDQERIDFAARREQWKRTYQKPSAQRPRSTARGVHHVALICSDVERTVWYRFTPAASGTYQIDTLGSDLDTVLTVFTGSAVGSLSEWACNDDVAPGTVTQSRVLAANLSKDAGPDDPARFVELAFTRVLSRPPTGEEQSECLQFLATQSQRFSTAGLTTFASGETPTVPPAKEPQQRARENLVHVLLNHNDFVTVR